jgi:hypothetical protein
VSEARKRVLGPEHVDTLSSMANLLRMYGALGEYQTAESILTDVVEKQKLILGDQHPQTVQSIQRLSDLHHWINDSKSHKIETSCKNTNLHNQNMTLTVIL